jgi:hypothetical protein
MAGWGSAAPTTSSIGASWSPTPAPKPVNTVLANASGAKPSTQSAASVLSSLLGGATPTGVPGGPGSTSTRTSSASSAASVPTVAAPSVDTKSDPQIQAAIDRLNKQIASMTAQQGKPDANLQYLMDEYKKRLAEDSSPENKAAALAQIRSAAGGMLESVGTGGAGAGGVGQAESRIADQAARMGAREVNNINQGAQQRLDALTLGGTGIAGGQANLDLQKTGQLNALLGEGVNASALPSSISQAATRLGLEGYNAQTGRIQAATGQYGAETQRQVAEQNAQNAAVQQWMQMLSAFGYGYA